MEALALWGGVECTVNRVGDRFHDQLRLSGHEERIEDLDMFAELGFSALRYPLLWERIGSGDQRDWRWSDARMARLRALGITVIAGLVHHGSGPAHTSLLDPGFAEGLAQHAGAVARRYPWIRDWTPVNEPLTTARFSALYGLWYPHRQDERDFWAALLNQIDAIRGAMKAVRAINPEARLIQTEDLGRTYATAVLEDQAGFDNVRRWISWDLLCGMVTRDHPFRERIARFGFEARLATIEADPCPPDVIGINHYLTSDRFLDHRLHRYPPHLHGGNGQRAYADVEAIRVLDPPPAGLAGAIGEAWARYGLPIAVTEAHNGCTREEQMRWTAETWRIAQAHRAEGVPVLAVTSWALLGSTGWNRLLTAPDEGHYEIGAFDMRGGRPRPTGMTRMLRALADGAPVHPVLEGSGWWRRSIRLLHGPVRRPAPMAAHLLLSDPNAGAQAPPLLITGATGTLGQAFARACAHRGIAHVLTRRRELDLGDRASIDEALDRHRPWAVVNAAGWVRVDEAEAMADLCFRDNCHGAVALGEACAARGIPVMTFSSDLVFDGGSLRPYVESDRPAPINAYGRSKAECERAILALGAGHLMVRTAAFFSPFDVHNFAVAAVRSLRAGQRFAVAADQVVSPTFVPDLVEASLDLVIDGADGLWHLSQGEAVSWSEFAQALARRMGLDAGLLDPVPGASFGWAARRPAYSALGSEKGRMLPPLSDAILRFAAGMASAQPRMDLDIEARQQAEHTARFQHAHA